MHGTNDPLESQVRAYLALGYRLTARSETSAQLVRPKSFSFGWAFLWFLVFGVGVFVYLAYYAAKQDAVVYLSLQDDGTVYEQGSGAAGPRPVPMAGTVVCVRCGQANVQPRTLCSRCNRPLARVVA